jgi:putative hydrolase of the HAD superfamily
MPTGGPTALVILDLDDTLIETAPLYAAASRRARAIVAAQGIDPELYDRRRSAIDVALVREMALSKEQFPEAAVRAYEELSREAGRKPDASISAELRATTAAVFSSQAPNIAGVRGALAELRRRGIKLVVLTKGDESVQAHRIAQSGLREYLSGVFVVPEKSDTLFRAIALWAGVPPERAVAVGNSRPSDVDPAVRQGMSGVVVSAKDVWHYEQRDSSIPEAAQRRVRQVTTIAGVPAAVVALLAQAEVAAPELGAA